MIDAALAVLRALATLAAIAMVFVPLEMVRPLRGVRLFSRVRRVDWLHAVVTPWLTAVLLALGGLASGALARAAMPTLLHRAVGALPGWLAFVLAVLLAEVASYALHYAMHVVPLLWRFHAVHHAPRELDFLAGARRHPVDAALSALALALPGLILGVPLETSAAFGVVYQLWTVFVHADVDVRLGPLERLVASPYFHHAHHAEDEVRPRNLATLLVALDLVFGTWRERPSWPVRYGTRDPVAPTWMGQVLGRWATVRESERPCASRSTS